MFGVMGGLLIYACRQRKELPPQYFPIAISGLCAAGVLSLVVTVWSFTAERAGCSAHMHARPLSDRRIATLATSIPRHHVESLRSSMPAAVARSAPDKTRASSVRRRPLHRRHSPERCPSKELTY